MDEYQVCGIFIFCFTIITTLIAGIISKIEDKILEKRHKKFYHEQRRAEFEKIQAEFDELTKNKVTCKDCIYYESCDFKADSEDVTCSAYDQKLSKEDLESCVKILQNAYSYKELAERYIYELKNRKEVEQNRTF